MKLLEFLHSSIVKYVIIRYVTYAIQFTNSLLLINYLSEYNFGVYSFILLVLSYYPYVMIGLNTSLNTLLSIYKKRENLFAKIWSVSLSLYLLYVLFAIVLVIIISVFYPDFFIKFQYNKYAFHILVIGLLINLNLLFVSLYRVYGKFEKINIQQLLPNLILLLLVLFFKDNLTIKLLLYSLIISHFIVLIIMFNRSPISLKPSTNKTIAKVLVYRGFNLMLYTFSFQFITMAATTIVSIKFNPAELGYYSFANTIANAIVMITASFMFILYPKMLNIFANRTSEQSYTFILKVRALYTLAVDIVSLSSFILLPIVYFFIPKYIIILNSFKILIASQIVLNNTSGFIQFLIAKKMEKKITFYGIISVIIVVITGFVFSHMQLPFYFMAFSVFLGLNAYTLSVVNLGLKKLGKKESKMHFIRTVYSYDKILVIFLIFTSVVLNDNIYIPSIILIMYVFVNRQEIVDLIKNSIILLKNNEIINF